MIKSQEESGKEPVKKARVFGRTYWMLNGIEMFERLAYFGMRAVVPVYIMQADDPGGLHFTAAMKGTIYAWWFVFQSILPTFTGGYADRYGYKKTLFLSVTMNIIGYLMMANLRTYTGFFGGVLVLASGTALFKPSLQGSLAQNLTKENSSVGWGIFYWVVNIGAVIGPFMATFVLGDPHTQASWRNLFTASAIITALNYFMLFTFKDVPSGSSKTETPVQVFVRTMKNIVEPRLVTWLLIMSCFWLMMYQLWDLHPNFIEDWVDSAGIANFMPAWLTVETDRGLMVPQQILLNLNAALIVLLMVPVSWLVRRMRVLSSMVIGMTVATAGILVAGLTGMGWILLLGIVFFSLGEMLTGPKKNEYLGLIAPPGKKGLYLGYVNIPVGIGGFVGSKMAGYLYGHYGEKATLALKYLADHTPGINWNGKLATLEEAVGVPRTEAVQTLMETTGMSAVEVTNLLWNTYHPQFYVWIPFAAIGVVAIIALVIFSQMAKKWADMNA
ncbi:MAG: MFS transporter [Candidatus Zixiibacteriota bacterium]|nr:MAG: MFS transporter [candidate division Zixibacteria bacterium]